MRLNITKKKYSMFHKTFGDIRINKYNAASFLLLDSIHCHTMQSRRYLKGRIQKERW